MRIALMADIPDDFITWCIKDGMKSHGQFYNPKASAKMATGFRNCGYGFAAQFVGKLLQLGLTKLF
jgi:hypothetical protein